jgi:hypothetical protein
VQLSVATLALAAWAFAATASDDLTSGLVDAVSLGNPGAITAAENDLLIRLDTSADPNARAAAVDWLIDAVSRKQSDDQGLLLADVSARILCRIKPWDLGDQAKNTDAAMKLHQAFEEAHGTDERERALDCAQVNFGGGYFTFLEEFERLYDTKNCKTFSLPDLASLEGLRTRAETVRRRIRAFEGSYYLARLDQRIAILDAAAGIQTVSALGGKETDARDRFGEAAARLEPWVNPARLSSTRTGWRLYSDFFTHYEFYRALSGFKEDAVKKLSGKGANWPTVLQQKELYDAIGDGVRAQISNDKRFDYVTPCTWSVSCRARLENRKLNVLVGSVRAFRHTCSPSTWSNVSPRIRSLPGRI